MRHAEILLLLATLAAAETQPIRLSSPHDGARPHSSFVAIVGETQPSTAVEIFDGGAFAATLQSDRDGRFERVVRLAAGRHEIRVHSGGSESTVNLVITAHAPPKTPAPYEMLQTGDVLLAHDRDSQQDPLYQPVYTHSALYIGPDQEGAPSVLEAVSEDNARIHGPVAAVPIEDCLAWREADKVDVFRLAGGLAAEDRTRIVDWARRTAARGLPFRSAEFGDLYSAWLLWDPKTDSPSDRAAFDSILRDLRDRLEASDAYDCATLVWRAYRDNTAAHINLASPDRVPWGGAAQQVSPRLAALLHPLFVLPDSFALSGKLRRVSP